MKIKDDSSVELREIKFSSLSTSDSQKSFTIPEKDPKWLGNCLAFFYKDHNPIFTIGPHCIFYNKI